MQKESVNRVQTIGDKVSHLSPILLCVREYQLIRHKILPKNAICVIFLIWNQLLH